MRIRGGILITPKDIQLITGSSCNASARREHLNIRDALGIKGKRITIKTYCDYWELNYEEIVNFLNDNR